MKSLSEWQAWGEIDPLYAVATVAGKAKTDDSPWSEGEFFASGLVAWNVFKRRWDAYGRPNSSCLEIGCGAGRLTRALASDFQRLDAIDVSPAMLRYATRSVPCPNVHFQLSSGAKVPLNDGAVDAVFSTHVFQHVNTIDEAINMFEEVFRVLSPTGSMMIHLPVIIWPGGATKRFHVAVDRLKAALGNIRAAVRRRAFKLGLQKKPIMRDASRY